MAEIQLQDIEKSFNDVVVVENLSLTIHDREFFTIVGPSGCGKSTILNMIAGLENTSGGSIAFDGEMIHELPPGKRDVAMVFQGYALYPHMTVYENMAFPLRIQKESRHQIDQEVRSMAALLGLEPLLRRKPKELSGGQRQRVALARAIIRKPSVFLMDEPLSNLDARLRIETRAELKRLHKEFPVTTVYVTHDQEEAMALSDRMAVFYQGKIQQCDRPIEIYRKPVNLFVAGFIGSPPMQFIEGAWLKEDAFSVLRAEGADPDQIIIGIRPADIVIREEKSEGDLEGIVEGLEPTGGDLWVDLRWKGYTIKGRAVSRQRISSGRPAYFNLHADQLHFFDKTRGIRL